MIASTVYRLFKPQIKGWLGEVGVHLCLKIGLDKSSYHIIRDVMLPTDEGTTQIDHIVVSRYGIFMVETKNYAGWIFGTEREATWTQKIHRYTKSFQNPLRQNYHHIKTLEELTGIPEEYFRTVVVFGGGATFKKAVPPGVVYPSEVARYVRSHQEVIIKDEQVPEIVEAIAEWAGTVNKELRANHVANLKRRHESSPASAQPPPELPPPLPAAPVCPVCPLCGAHMVLRTKRNSTNRFWGCSTFPDCRGLLPEGWG